MAKAKKVSKTETPSGGQTPNLPALSSGAQMTKDIPEGYKAKRAITLPSLSIKPGTFYNLRIEDAMRISTVRDKPAFEADGKTKKKPRDPATICTVTDVITGEQYTYLVNSVVQENLRRDFPNDTYVGKVFKIANMGKRQENQKYYDFSIIELEAS